MNLNKLKKLIKEEIKLLTEQSTTIGFEGPGSIGPNIYPVFNGISQIYACYQPSGQPFTTSDVSQYTYNNEMGTATPNPMAIGIGECGRVNIGCIDNFNWPNTAEFAFTGPSMPPPLSDQIGLLENPTVPWTGQTPAILIGWTMGSYTDSMTVGSTGISNPCCNDNNAAPNDCYFGCHPGTGTQLYNYWNPIDVTEVYTYMSTGFFGQDTGLETDYNEYFCGWPGYGPMATIENTFFTNPVEGDNSAYFEGLAYYGTMMQLFGNGYSFYPDMASCEAACIPENAPEGYELEGCMDPEAINYFIGATSPAPLALPWSNIASDPVQETSGGCEYEIECWRCGFAPEAQWGDPSIGPISQTFITTQPPFFWSSEEGYNVEYYQNNPELGIEGFGCKEFGQVYSQNPENLNCDEIGGPTDALEDLPFNYDLDNDGVADITPIKTSEYEDLWVKNGCNAFDEFIDMINGFTSYQVPQEISIQEAKIIFCKRCKTISADGLIGFPDIKETWCDCCPPPDRPMEPELDDTIDPTNPPRYNCSITTSLGTCVEDPFGPFFSIEECEESGCLEGIYLGGGPQNIAPLPDDPQKRRMQELAGINPEKK